MFYNSLTLDWSFSRYQAEDHTVQRRSFKCYPIDDRDGSDLQLTDRSGILWTSVTAVAATIVVLATLLLAFATYYFRRNALPNFLLHFSALFNFFFLFHFSIVGQPTPPREENSKLIKDTSGNNDRLPPPYDQIGLSRTSDGYTIVSVHEESLNEATPFGRPFFPEAEPDVHNQPDNHLNIGEPQQDSSSMAGSTETIPSLWEPRDDDPPNGSTQGLGRARPAGRLVRSLSLGSLPAVRPASVPATRSCSDLSDGIYRHRHIRLSNYRRSGLPGKCLFWILRYLTLVLTNLSVIESKIDLYEPLPPQSFVFRDPGTQQGSQDSGFFQDVPSSSSNSTARRRPAANDVEIQFAIALFAKRRRQD